MKNATATEVNSRAYTQGHFNTSQLPLFTNLEPEGFFSGTDNPRHLRMLAALDFGAVSREELDRIAGCSNSPEHIAQLRRRGLEIPCEFVPCIDRDGRASYFGLYRLSANDRVLIKQWQQRVRDGE